MITNSFIAERQPNGDVWIKEKRHPWNYSIAYTVIPKEHCDELAMLLLRDSPIAKPECKLVYTGTMPRTDYTRGSDDPE